ncbi:hypothetical protein BC351_04125 [Paenibacillus ferrarius]|uniref:Uncharacterized protein n=1 Tax=Paenibacillus ferrarius TaxID=1469647 RepID=A0A1V4HL38_9BACL|nr:hypothetical protein BC351_04125 [Paenibacillus ferrarius]
MSGERELERGSMMGAKLKACRSAGFCNEIRRKVEKACNCAGFSRTILPEWRKSLEYMHYCRNLTD